jgi:hypothetical protein
MNINIVWDLRFFHRLLPGEGGGARGSLMVKALGYKLEGRGFETQ